MHSEVQSPTHKDVFLNMIRLEMRRYIWSLRKQEGKQILFLPNSTIHTLKNPQAGQQPNEVWFSVALVSSENRLKNQKSAIFIAANGDFGISSNFCRTACCHVSKPVLPAD